MEKELSDPCSICLVRPCCTKSCAILVKYMLAVLKVVSQNHNHIVLRQFSEQQAKQIISASKIISRNKDSKDEHSKEDPAM